MLNLGYDFARLMQQMDYIAGFPVLFSAPISDILYLILLINYWNLFSADLQVQKRHILAKGKGSYGRRRKWLQPLHVKCSKLTFQHFNRDL